MAGHVFLVHGDITRLAADAWLLPGGPEASPGETWIDAVGSERPEPLAHGWSGAHPRVARWTKKREQDPEPILVDLGGSQGTPIAWYVDAARQFLTRALEIVRPGAPRHGRARHLLALPLVGTGGGGKQREAGALARVLLPALYDFVDEHEADVALVMIEGAAYSAAQVVRRRELQDRAWRLLDPALAERADHLALRAARGEIVLFIGAGVGSGAGLPLWSSLLNELAREAAGMSEQAIALLNGLSVLDRAQVIEARLPKDETLGGAVANLLVARSTHYSIAHALLSALPVNEAVTTNYDTLFEQASNSQGRTMTVLPYHRLEEGGRWLLKLHGDVAHPKDIVLTRESFLTYRERREALAGIVQALLITRHMLFVGFSLEDDNFHQIVRAVRRAVTPGHEAKAGGGGAFGTSLMVSANPLTEELWRGSLEWIPLGVEREPTAEIARRLDIFLDRVAAGATEASRHLFDERYEEVLSIGERETRDLLMEVLQRASKEARGTRAFERFEQLLAHFGRR